MATRRRTQRHAGEMPSHTRQQEEVDGDTSMPEPPTNWPPITNHSISQLGRPLSNGSHEEQEPDQEQGEDQSSCQTEQRQRRGPTWMHGGWGDDGGILKIEVNEFGQPIEKPASRLASHLGVIARNGIMAPLTYIDWRIIPSYMKDNIWNHIKEHTNATDEMRGMLMQSLSKKWKDWKSIAKLKGYDAYHTNDERLAHCPDRVEQIQWRKLVHYWDSKEAKDKSAKNKAIRALMTMPHINGRQSNAQVREDMTKEKGGVRPTRKALYARTHTKKDGKPSSDTVAKAIDDMNALETQHPELAEKGVARDDIYAQVMGPERHGRVRTLGLGVTPSIVFGSSYRKFQAERRDTEIRLQHELERVQA